jgi:cyclophilin family peptidyl-prolyl cis-trans isomerase
MIVVFCQWHTVVQILEVLSSLFVIAVTILHLDRRHTCFGKVVEGLDVIDQIRQGDKIISITIVEEEA